MTVVLARAKLTLSLRITGVRADGYHLLDSEMVTLDLADRLTFEAGDGLVVSGLGASGGLGGAGGAVPGGPENLVRRALVAAGRTALVRLEKHIPTGGGLGGGSADAAAVLRWAGVDDAGVAVGLGADVPFCLLGGGRARVRGVGEIVDTRPFEEVAGRAYTLLVPPLHVSTVDVYREWDRMGGPVGDGGNDLEPAALSVEPALAEWRDRLGDLTGETPRLAGSGATWFVPGAFEGPGLTVVRVQR